MRLLVVGFCALIAALSSITPAWAETLNTPDDLAKSRLFMGYLQGNVRNQLVIDFVAATDRKYGQACNQPYLIRIVSITVERPVLIGPGSLAPDDGVWSEKLSAQRCGRTSVVNIMFVAGESPVPRPVELLPGMTAASPQLMRDVLPMAMSGAALAVDRQKPGARDCKQVRAIDTSQPTIIGDKRTEPNSIVGRMWFETWTFDVCGTQAQVKVNFSENLVTKGTNFAVGPN
jgi:hypothetical protein